MNPIVENFLTHLKSKQLKDWSIMELEDHAFTIQYIYMYCGRTEEEEKAVLKSVYSKICDWVNGSKRGTVINPGFLNRIDKEGI